MVSVCVQLNAVAHFLDCLLRNYLITFLKIKIKKIWSRKVSTYLKFILNTEETPPTNIFAKLGSRINMYMVYLYTNWIYAGSGLIPMNITRIWTQCVLFGLSVYTIGLDPMDPCWICSRPNVSRSHCVLAGFALGLSSIRL